jgi:hypothetical protein
MICEGSETRDTFLYLQHIQLFLQRTSYSLDSMRKFIMKYEHIMIYQFGGPENLSLAKDELLEPRANEVRVNKWLD